MDEADQFKNEHVDGTHINKTQVLQEAKQCFINTSAKTKRLVDVLTKCIVLLLQGERLTNIEATDLFFHITRLFQYKDKDSTLRRLTYISIRTLSQRVEIFYVVMPRLRADLEMSTDPVIQASALRALCMISDPTAIELELKKSILNENPIVASAALTSLIRIAQVNGEIVRRCTNEIQEALNSDSPMVQYHALALRYMSCKSDRLATSRLLTTCMNQGLKSPLAICLFLRILANYINDAPNSDDIKKYLACIRDYLDHPSEMVEYEAASTIIKITKDPTKLQKFKVTSSVAHLRNFLTSPKASLRFSSLRLLNEIAVTSSADVKYWSAHRIGNLCKLHLLNKRYRPGDEIMGLLDFAQSNVVCARYTCILQCEELEQFESKQEFSLGFKRNSFSITVPAMETQQGSILHCVLSFLFYIADKNYPKALFEDRAGTIELGPSELETKLFSCDFPIAIYT